MAASDTKLSLEENTNVEGGAAKSLSSSQRQYDVPDECTLAPKRGDNTRNEKEDGTFIHEKGIGIDPKVRAAKRPQHAYEDTSIDKETSAGPDDTAPSTDTYPQPGADEPRYLHLGDHVVVYSGHELESEDAYGYKESQNVNTGHEKKYPSHNYEDPEDIHGYKKPENVSTGHMYNEDLLSHDYEKPEDAHGYENPENMSTGYDKGSSSYNYEKPEYVQGYEKPKNVSTGHETNAPSHNYEKPENVHEYENPENVSKGHGGGSSFHDHDKPEDVHVYKEPDEGNTEHKNGSSSHNYDKPEDVHVYKEPDEGNTGHKNGSSSHDYDKPEDVHVYKESDEGNTGHKNGSSSHDYDKPEDVHVYKESDEGNTGHKNGSSSHNYDKPEDVLLYKEPDEGNTGHKEGSSSHDYDKPEDVRGDNDPEDGSFAYKAKARLMEIWNNVKSSRLCWLALGCGLLATASIIVAILVPHLVPVRKETHESKNEDSVLNTANPTTRGSPWWTTVYMGNSSAAINSTLPSPPSANTGLATEAAINSTLPSPPSANTGLATEAAIKSTPSFPPSANTGLAAEAAIKSTLSSPPSANTGLDEETLPTTLPSLSTTARPCKSGWSEYNNHCYKFFRDQLNWSEANKKCKELGANLASVTSAEENNFIAGLIVNAPKRVTRHLVWFGLRLVDKQWKWTDGSPLSYTNWAPGEPGKNWSWWPGKSEDCSNVYSQAGTSILGAKGEKGQWNDHKCSNGFSYVCKTPK
ncbi:VCAN [Branchiostoma lanceolatum]|uniref:VCAN protein n=1 Tax=Branchiostoma lanceolatum TaxID=7740 RepID=A0A8J9Z006_BRALA|nr:VCAN [Branchiostoma lanceolatum]